MSTAGLSEIPLGEGSPAQRLRRTAAAVRVHFTWWGVHKTLTGQQKEEVGLAYGADSRLLTAGKRLVDVRHAAFRRLTSLRTRIVHYWRGLTLPYVEDGMRLIRQTDIEGFVQSMTGFRDELVEAEANLNAVYDEVLADAQKRLGRLYNPHDYPDQVRGLFQVDWEFPSVEPPNYLARISPELFAQEQARVAQRFEEAVRLAEEAFVAEFGKIVSHLTERLSGADGGEPKVFRDSAVGNLREFFARFQLLSVRSNEQLDALVAEAQQIVQGLGPQDLRDNDGLRRHVAVQLTKVQSELDGLLVDQPRRRIIRPYSTANGESHGPGH
jgi:hypothetical protein